MDSSDYTGKKHVEQNMKPRELTRWERKKLRIMGEAKTMRNAFFTGFLVGGAVGCLFGSLTGSYLAYQYRQISLIPLAALSSGCTFGFFMGIGSVIRSPEAQQMAMGQ